jgi:hypothetical protein
LTGGGGRGLGGPGTLGGCSCGVPYLNRPVVVLIRRATSQSSSSCRFPIMASISSLEISVTAACKFSSHIASDITVSLHITPWSFHITPYHHSLTIPYHSSKVACNSLGTPWPLHSTSSRFIHITSCTLSLATRCISLATRCTSPPHFLATAYHFQAAAYHFLDTPRNSIHCQETPFLFHLLHPG